MVAGKLDGTISFEEVRRLLDYDQHSGDLRWREWRGKRGPKGGRAGTTKPRGHVEVKIYGIRYQAHRLVWLWMTGLWPELAIDHRDCNPGNNAWSNLREATDRQQMHNRKALSSNKLGIKGVHAVTSRRGVVWYKAQINLDGKVTYLGRFKTPQQAHEAYKIASGRHFGLFARD